MQTTITVLAWIGLVCVTALAVGTLYFWALWLWERLVERAPWPVGLYRVTKAATQLSLTRNKTAHVAGYVSAIVHGACEKSAEFKAEFRRLLSEARTLD